MFTNFFTPFFQQKHYFPGGGEEVDCIYGFIICICHFFLAQTQNLTAKRKNGTKTFFPPFFPRNNASEKSPGKRQSRLSIPCSKPRPSLSKSGFCLRPVLGRVALIPSHVHPALPRRGTAPPSNILLVPKPTKSF